METSRDLRIKKFVYADDDTINAFMVTHDVVKYMHPEDSTDVLVYKTDGGNAIGQFAFYLSLETGVSRKSVKEKCAEILGERGLNRVCKYSFDDLNFTTISGHKNYFGYVHIYYKINGPGNIAIFNEMMIEVEKYETNN